MSLTDAKVRVYMVYLKYYTLNLRPLMVYPKVLFRPNFSTKLILDWCRHSPPGCPTKVTMNTGFERVRD